ncbi:hypothetical protein [Hymenobacter jejuensis]|uniref:DUF4890 domain-containing protein n=1 Tax=Hymenobacter jejuensis TaxID=2502781 RepID=A0A5B8A1T0_9BACT|nr:hypothetical protein [Hymenobacter jejuensis]QDA60616.1 hypothetical protein FHG12_11115 [Hymenobacter jejuensis]
MKKLLATALLVVSALLAQQAHAQTAMAPEIGTPPGSQPKETSARKNKKASGSDIARMQRRMSMNPDEAKRDQQLEILEARSGGGTANTSFGRGSGPARQYEKNSGGFVLRKFKDKRRGTARQKRGQLHAAPGIDPKGKPLKHKVKSKSHFLFF